MRKYKGTIADTKESCIMVANGYWVSNGRHITSYERVDKKDPNIYRQYSKDRHNRFYVETEDTILYDGQYGY